MKRSAVVRLAPSRASTGASTRRVEVLVMVDCQEVKSIPILAGPFMLFSGGTQ